MQASWAYSFHSFIHYYAEAAIQHNTEIEIRLYDKFTYRSRKMVGAVGEGLAKLGRKQVSIFEEVSGNGTFPHYALIPGVRYLYGVTRKTKIFSTLRATCRVDCTST